WTPRRRIAYLGWADRVRRSSVSLDTACVTAQGGFAHVEERSSRRARAGLVVALAPPSLVWSEIRLAQAAPSKPLTPQQKMKECAGKWQDEKAKTGVKGRTAYRKFMGDCLKKAPA